LDIVELPFCKTGLVSFFSLVIAAKDSWADGVL
jgi:hypothetical protein